MAAPKGNRNAAKFGREQKFSVRAEEGDLSTISLFTPTQRGIALVGYLLWLESPESEEIGFIEWMKSKTQ